MFKGINLWLKATFGDKANVKKIEEVIEVAVKNQEPPKRYITYHAKQRFRERHGVVFTDEQAKYIVEDILAKKAEFVSEQHDGTEEWIAEYEGNKYRVIFALNNKVIVTVYSGIKDKHRKPTRKNKRPKNNGRQQKRLDRKPQPASYKRKTRVEYEYEEAI